MLHQQNAKTDVSRMMKMTFKFFGDVQLGFSLRHRQKIHKDVLIETLPRLNLNFHLFFARFVYKFVCASVQIFICI
jgi:hypothetical protein